MDTQNDGLEKVTGPFKNGKFLVSRYISWTFLDLHPSTAAEVDGNLNLGKSAIPQPTRPGVPHIITEQLETYIPSNKHSP